MSNEPYITIDLKDYLIRIPRVTLSILGNPDFVQLLIHPENRKLALRKCSDNERYANRVNKTLLDTDNSYELYSRFLLNSLQGICENFRDGQAYRLTGTIHEGKSAVTFDMSNAKSIKGSREGDDR